MEHLPLSAGITDHCRADVFLRPPPLKIQDSVPKRPRPGGGSHLDMGSDVSDSGRFSQVPGWQTRLGRLDIFPYRNVYWPSCHEPPPHRTLSTLWPSPGVGKS